MTKETIYIETVEAGCDTHRIELVYLGCGQYVGQWTAGSDDDDPVLRYDIMVRTDSGEWDFFDDEAHYTQISAFAPLPVRQFAVEWMMRRLQPVLESGDAAAVSTVINEIENTPGELFVQLHASHQAEKEIADSFGAAEALSARPSRTSSLSI